MMELIFNELTLQPVAGDFTECYKRVYRFVEAFKESQNHGFQKKIRFQATFPEMQLGQNCTLADFCRKPVARTLSNLLLSICRHPFIDDNTKEEEQYIQNRFFILRDEEKLSVHGLAAAYLYQTIGIGFCSESFWEDIRFSMLIESEESKSTEILSVSCPEHFKNPIFVKWKEDNSEVKLVECDTPVSNKHISLRDDHGKDILVKFAKRLCSSPYVVEIVNSLPFNPHETEFIRKTTPEGLIEIVLTNTDKGLGLVVRTTGRNNRETKEIAKILKKQFSIS